MSGSTIGASHPLSKIDGLSRQKYLEIKELTGVSRDAFMKMKESRRGILQWLSHKKPDLSLCGKKVFFSRIRQEEAEKKAQGKFLELEKRLKVEKMSPNEKRSLTIEAIQNYRDAIVALEKKNAGRNRIFRLFFRGNGLGNASIMRGICDRILKNLKEYAYEGEFKNNGANGKGRLICANRDCYTGGFEKGQRHGKGLLIHQSGDYEMGQFIHDQFQGIEKGRKTFANGNCYEGEFKNNEPGGKGRLIYANGDCYEGEFKNGEPHGKGWFICATGDFYEGNFENGKRNGKGRLTYTDGKSVEGIFEDGTLNTFYRIPAIPPHETDQLTSGRMDVHSGSFNNGIREEAGRLTLEDGRVYEGTFRNGLPDGEVRVTYKNGVCYTVNFRDGKPNGKSLSGYSSSAHPNGGITGINHEAPGKGRITYISGAIYEGQMNDERRHGKGKMIYPNGDVYVGNFRDDQCHGNGVLTYASGAVYDGKFENGKRQGAGMLRYPNGDVYQGDFYDDGIQGVGEGQRTLPSGDYYKGEFRNGKPYGAGAGRQTYTDGTVYEGELKNGRPHGKGKVTFENGIVYEGNFSHGQFDGEGVLSEVGHLTSSGWENGVMTVKLPREHVEKEREKYMSPIWPGELIKNPVMIAQYDNNNQFVSHAILSRDDLAGELSLNPDRWLKHPTMRYRLSTKVDKQGLPVQPTLNDLELLSVDRSTQNRIEELKSEIFRIDNDMFSHTALKREVGFNVL